jgi:hypothetical protein
MNAPKRSAPGTGIAGATKLRVVRSYAACPHNATAIERRPQVHALYAREILTEIMRLRAMQEPIGRIFWGLEQWIARLTDEIERRRS